MATAKPRCSQIYCFANKCGASCEILTSSPSIPCPFYKTDAEYENGQIEAHNLLLKKGRHDLIEKYEFNEARKRQW